MRTPRDFLLVAAGLLGLSVQAPAALPERVEAEPAGLQQCASLVLRVAGLFRIGTAGLYLADCADHERILEPVPKQFSLLLDREFSGRDLSETALDLLRDNLGVNSAEEIPESLRCLAGAYVDAGPGQRFDVRYLPGESLSLYLDGEALARCTDDGHAAGFFAIWFGEAPFHRRMRDTLLARAAEGV